jgi:hypothetical protein
MRYDPRDQELRAWLATLSPEDQYITRCALLRLFRSFQKDGDFKADTEAMRFQVKPGGRDLKAAREKAERIEQTLRKQAEQASLPETARARSIQENPRRLARPLE